MYVMKSLNLFNKLNTEHSYYILKDVSTVTNKVCYENKGFVSMGCYSYTFIILFGHYYCMMLKQSLHDNMF